MKTVSYMKQITLSSLLTIVMLVIGTQAYAESRFTYAHTDLFGGVVALTNHAGNVIARKDYTPYGESSGNDGSNHIGFTGHVENSLTNLTYMQQRMQDPKTGRFLSMDSKPVDPNDPLSFNRYVYANNNPYKFIDPDGREVYNPSDYKVDTKTMENLHKLDKSTPGTDWWITSGIRSEEENSDADGATASRHLEKHGGDAVDVAPAPKSGQGKLDMDDLAKKAGEAGFKGIITYKTEDGTSKNPYGGRLHLDRREESYNAEAKKSTGGGTVYKQKSSTEE